MESGWATACEGRRLSRQRALSSGILVAHTQHHYTGHPYGTSHSRRTVRGRGFRAFALGGLRRRVRTWASLLGGVAACNWRKPVNSDAVGTSIGRGGGECDAKRWEERRTAPRRHRGSLFGRFRRCSGPLVRAALYVQAF